MIAQARDLRDDLAGSTDVATLTTWIDRNAAYDAALRRLYDALLDSDGRVTDRVRSAFEGEQAARRQLPPDTRGLVVIMSDIARGGLNQAVIAIEEARGALSSAHRPPGALQQPPGARRVGLAVGSGAGTLARKFPASYDLPGGTAGRDAHREDSFVQIRVVTDQPWEVSTDVLVVPVVGELEFTGAYDELDRRSGGELRALQAFGELRRSPLRDRARRVRASCRRGGCSSSRRGHAEDLDRETVRKFAASRDPAPDQPRRQGDGGLAGPAGRVARRGRRARRRRSSRGAWSRAASSPRRSTARTATRRRRSSTSWC